MRHMNTPRGPAAIALLVFLLVGVSFLVSPGVANDQTRTPGQVFDGRDGPTGQGKDSRSGPGGGGNEADPDWFVTDSWSGIELTREAPQSARLYVFGPYGGFLNWLFGQFGSYIYGFGR